MTRPDKLLIHLSRRLHSLGNTFCYVRIGNIHTGTIISTPERKIPFRWIPFRCGNSRINPLWPRQMRHLTAGTRTNVVKVED